MSTRMQQSERKEREWRAIVERWAGSGMSVRAFCRARGLSEPSFYAWRRTLAARDRAMRDGAARDIAGRDATGASAARDGSAADAARPSGQSVPAAHFVPVRIAPQSALETTATATVECAAALPSALQLLVGAGRRLCIGPGFDGPTLRRLLALLEEGRP